MSRPDLEARVHDGLDAGRLVILAGAGYGKTTLLAQSLPGLDMPWVWCGCDERLDPAALIAHLTAGIGERFAGFGAGMGQLPFLEELVLAFSNEIATAVPEPFALILDDVHRLPDGSQQALGFALHDLPPSVRVAISARRGVPQVTAGFDPAGSVTIAEQDLAFGREECAAIVRRADPSLAEAEVASLVDHAGGWVAALVLAARSRTRSSGDLPRREMYAFLAREVFESQDPAVREFLLDVSVLERFSPVLAEEISGRADADALCAFLLEQRLVTSSAFDDSLRFHQLLRRFLSDRLADSDPERFAQLHRQAAAAFSASGETIDAVDHLIAAGDHAEAARQLADNIDRLLAGPQALGVVRLLEQLPPEVWATRPELILAAARMRLYTGIGEEALPDLRRAIDALIDLGDEQRASLAIFLTINAMQLAGLRPPLWIEVCEQALTRLPRELPMVAAAQVMLAYPYGAQARLDDAQTAIDRALANPASAHFPALLAFADAIRAHCVLRLRGHLGEAFASYQRGVDALEPLPFEEDPGNFLAIAHFYYAFGLSAGGRFEEALAHGRRGSAVAARRGAPGIAARVDGWLFILTLAALGDWENARPYLAGFRPHLPHLEGTVIGNAYHAVNARLSVHDGDAGAAVAEIDALLTALETEWGLHEVEFVLPEIVRSCDELSDQARADRASEFHVRCAESLGLPWGLARALALTAACHSDAGRCDDATARVLDLSERHGFTALWTDRDRWLSGRVLSRALSREIGDTAVVVGLAAACGGEVFDQVIDTIGDPSAEVRNALLDAARRSPAVPAESRMRLEPTQGARPQPVSATAAAPVPGREDLRFMGLGGFAVFRGDERIRSGEFGRARARALLAALLCAGEPVHRDRLLEWFWPDLDPERGLRAFGVTLHGLRRALEPQRERGTPSVIVAQGETYAMNFGDRDTWDAIQFELAAKGALETSNTGSNEAVSALSAALEQYGGLLFPEWAYEEWSEPARGRLAETQRQLLAALGGRLVAADRAADAVPVLRRLVEAEPESEAWHRELMSAYDASGDGAMALRQFQACRTILRRELGVDAGPETRALYQEILERAA